MVGQDGQKPESGTDLADPNIFTELGEQEGEMTPGTIATVVAPTDQEPTGRTVFIYLPREDSLSMKNVKITVIKPKGQSRSMFFAYAILLKCYHTFCLFQWSNSTIHPNLST